MWNLKYNTNEHNYKTEADSQTPENTLVAVKAGCWERGGEGRIGSLGLADANYYI